MGRKVTFDRGSKTTNGMGLKTGLKYRPTAAAHLIASVDKLRLVSAQQQSAHLRCLSNVCCITQLLLQSHPTPFRSPLNLSARLYPLFAAVGIPRMNRVPTGPNATKQHFAAAVVAYPFGNWPGAIWFKPEPTNMRTGLSYAFF